MKKKTRKEREKDLSLPPTHIHTVERKRVQRESIYQNILIIRAAVIRTHHGEIKWPGWRGRIQTTLETPCKRIEQGKRKKALGTVATKVQAYVSLRPFYWQSSHSPLVDHYPGRDCTHQTFPDTEPRRQKANWEKLRYTVSPWFVKTRPYSESTQARGFSFQAAERKDERTGKDGRAPDAELRPLSASVYINLSLLLSETEQKTLWREDKSRRCYSERLRSHPSDLAVIDKQVCRFSEGPRDNRGVEAWEGPRRRAGSLSLSLF